MNETDLIADFFTRNLEQSEDAALAALLESSPEAAERFAALAGQDYQRLGLPKPVPPNPLLAGLKLGGLGLLALAALFYWWNQPTQTRSVAVGVLSQPDREVSLPRPEPRRPSPGRPDEDLQPRAQAGPGAAPRLSISMETRQGPFDVKVLGGQAQPVGVLDNAGVLVGRLTPVGPRAWAWDARTKDGAPAAPGRYRICLLAGDRPLRQWVEIERR
ncbi:MAG TPA: hypothetical protein VNZ54_10785 [bacterium]|nr:hypothetical protein [bacterium]